MKSNNTTKDICLMFTNDAIITHNDLCHEVIDMLLKKHKSKAKVYVPQIFQLRMQKHLNFEEMSELAQTEYEKYIKRISENSFKGQFVFFSEVEKKKYYTEYRQFADDIENHKGVAYEYMWDNDTKKLEYIYPEVEEILANVIPDKKPTYIDGGLHSGTLFNMTRDDITNTIIKTIVDTMNNTNNQNLVNKNELKFIIDEAVSASVGQNMLSYFQHMDRKFRERLEQYAAKIAEDRVIALEYSKKIAEQKKEHKSTESQSTDDDETLYNAEELSEILNLRKKMIYHRARVGFHGRKLKHVRKSKKIILFRKEDVIKHFEKYPPRSITPNSPKKLGNLDLPSDNNATYKTEGEKVLLSVKEAADLVKCDYSTIYNRTARGFKGRKLKYIESDVNGEYARRYYKQDVINHFKKYPLTGRASINRK